MPKNNASMSWLDWERPAGAEDNGPSYPVIQWFNGGQGGDSPVLKSGGWELPAKWFQGILGNSFPLYDVEHSGAKNDDGTEPAYLFPVLKMAVVMKHVDYYRGVGADRVWSPVYQDGFYSRVKLLAFVKEIEEVKPLTPVVVTFRSSVSRDFGAVARQFRAEVIDRADTLAVTIAQERGLPVPQKFMTYAFWLPVGSGGKRVKTGNEQKSMYAPLTGHWDSNSVKSDERGEVVEALELLATPPYIRQFVANQFYEEARAWLKAEREKLGQADTGEPEEEGEAELKI